MLDLLKDIVAHTNKLGFLNIIKVIGSSEQTLIESMAEDRSVVLYAETTDPYPDLLGTFGMPQLEKLAYLVDGKEYQEGAKIELTKAQRQGVDILTGLHFENKDGDFKNDYLFVNQNIVDEKLKTVTFKGVKWNLTLNPSVQAIQRFAFQAGANTEHTTCVAKTEGDKLIFTFGGMGTHGGEFVFATGITGSITKAWPWPINPVLSILKIADSNNTTMSFSNEGALQIELDSGIAKYKYIIPAQT
jgi:hypothetical protein